ncbi:unnamed protein product [Pieris macdunnoughi]|uniref:Lipocalin/cytosolic fatty-acid binding domain-containing protein n=2 Tax=Pieris macdunnoughi TaxID=345717 RepID=A0A821T6P0_9NEOP|nr:unnamed protein product [Pieris macdunnoughi]
MYKNMVILFLFKIVQSQILQFGNCSNITTMDYFQIDKFLGKWYVIEQYPVWYEEDGHCAFKVFELCERRVRIQSGYVKDKIQYIVTVNSTYYSGDDAIFEIEKNNIDPVGVPLSVITTDYANYSLLYGCRVNENLQLKYMTAWILSRSLTLSPDILETAYRELNAIPDASSGYLQTVDHNESKCAYQWTAEIHAVNTSTND